MRYYLWVDGAEVGPIDETEFVERYANGRLPHDASARSEIAEKFSTVEEVRASIAERAFSRAQSVRIGDPDRRGVVGANPTMEPCPVCERMVSRRAAICPNCGHPINGFPEKSRGVYVVLGIFFGLLGIHNFYAGRLVHGTIQALVGITTVALMVMGVPIVPVLPLASVWVWVVVELFAVRFDGAGRPMT